MRCTLGQRFLCVMAILFVNTLTLKSCQTCEHVEKAGLLSHTQGYIKIVFEKRTLEFAQYSLFTLTITYVGVFLTATAEGWQ